MKLSSLTYLASETIAVLDGCPGLDLSFKEVHDAADRKHLVEHLANRYGCSADLSLLLSQKTELAAVNQLLHEVAGGIYGREHKLGVAKNGVCLVLGLIIEAIQWHSRDNQALLEIVPILAIPDSQPQVPALKFRITLTNGN